MSTASYMRAAISYDATARSAGFGVVAALALSLHHEEIMQTHGLSAKDTLATAATVLGAESENVGKNKAGELTIKIYYSRAAKTVLLRAESLVVDVVKLKVDAAIQVAKLAEALEARFKNLRALNGVKAKSASKKAGPQVLIFRLLSKITSYDQAQSIADFAALRVAFLDGDEDAKPQMDELLATAVNPRLAALRAAIANGTDLNDGAEDDGADDGAEDDGADDGAEDDGAEDDGAIVGAEESIAA